MNFPFKRGGFLHELLEQSGLVCLVRRSRDGRAHFEVAVLQYHAERQLPDGCLIPAGWGYPSSGQWGEAGWTYHDLAKARPRYQTLARKQGLRRPASINTATAAQNEPQRQTVLEL